MYAQLLITYIVHARINRSHMYYMHDYPDCARVCHSERVRDGFFTVEREI